MKWRIIGRSGGGVGRHVFYFGRNVRMWRWLSESDSGFESHIVHGGYEDEPRIRQTRTQKDGFRLDKVRNAITGRSF